MEFFEKNNLRCPKTLKGLSVRHVFMDLEKFDNDIEQQSTTGTKTAREDLDIFDVYSVSCKMIMLL